MRRHLAKIGITLAITTVGLTYQAVAQQWQVCNRTADPLRVAIGYAVPGGLLRSEGWFGLGSCSGCAVVLLPDETVDRSQVYLYAETTRGAVPIVEGSQAICVDTRKGSFKIRRTENCEGRNFKTKLSQPVTVDMRKDFTTNIRGAKTCNQ